MKKILCSLVVILAFLMFVSCGVEKPPEVSTSPVAANTQAPVVSEAQAPATAANSYQNGVDITLIEQMKQYISEKYINIKSFILIRDGQTIDETYFDANVENKPARIFSCTKSIISALVGIAIHEGSIPGVDEKIVNLLDMKHINPSDDRISDITLKQLLTMSSGIDVCPHEEYVQKDDAVKYILEQPMQSEPGSVFAYTSAGPHIVSAILQKATGMETSEYAQQKLFDPLGIESPEWQKDNNGLSLGGFGLYLTPRDLTKFGMLYLNEGSLDGTQIVPKEWANESTSLIVDTPSMVINDGEKYGYGYYWWQNGFGGYAARGYAGQFIFVLPQKNVVAVFTSQLNEADFPIPYRLMEQYVVPALK